ncbi:formylglycine-generating enzyme family protein [Segatella hominis]|uniref:formylglycine-generating enzyme family protein n=1 Tax=Segatella hominis TaxID=2518605 RepID=UPI00296F8FC0|nr:formylglycine-generating enzyme family protein [Segatella hominis]WOZ80504.1 formylglycine-generating enzyme family protein [Segatella hominis]
MKHILFLIFGMMLCLSTFAQKLSVESFSLSATDISAQTQQRKDLNNEPCALVKVQFVGDILDVEGNVIKPLVKKGNETWAYMTHGSLQMKVLTKDYLPIMVDFSNYGISQVEKNKTYVLVLTKPVGGAEPVDAGGNFYALSVQPKNAMLTIDGVLQPSSSDGEYSAMLPYGTHTYKVEAGGYISKSGSFTVSSGDMTPISVSLLSAMASVSITCPTPAVSLYVDKKAVGNSPWSGSLKEGMHLLEARKSGYRSQQKTIQLAQQQKLDVTFGELVAIQGNLSVNYKPFGADVYVDGKKLGQSPRVFNGLLVGNHQVEVRKDGYATDRKSVSISEGQTASITGTLASNAVASSSSNTLGYSSASSSMSSGSNTISIPVKNGISIDMVKVEAGTFMMGATSEMKDPYDNEKPVHQVTLTNDYYMGMYEVPQALWEAVMGSNPSEYKGDNLPVEMVSWNDCQEFISKLNSLTGRKFRLPTEAEWEYAAHGGKKSRGYQYSGNSNISDVAWYDGNSGSKPHPVGTKQANELGIYDMSGNVYEWCSDWYGSYSSSSQTNPTGADSGSGRVVRGGSWYDFAWGCRLSYRGSITPFYRGNDLGLRLALSE